jgi:hypothetical protein
VALEMLGGGLQLFFEPKNQIPNVWGFNPHRAIKCSMIGIVTLFSFSPIPTMFFSLAIYCQILKIDFGGFLSPKVKEKNKIIKFIYMIFIM